MVDISLTALQLSKYPPLFTSTWVNNLLLTTITNDNYLEHDKILSSHLINKQTHYIQEHGYI